MMETEVQIMVIAGGSYWDHIILTHNTVISSRNGSSSFKLKNDFQAKNCTGNSVAVRDKYIRNEWDKDEVTNNYQYQKYEGQLVAQILCNEYIDFETRHLQCFKQHVLYNTQMDNIGYGSKGSTARKSPITKFSVHYKTGGQYFAVFLRELRTSKTYRQMVLQNWTNCHSKDSQSGTRKKLIIQWKLKDTVPYVIDYQWCIRMNRCTQERQQLDNSMSWLSTLGGACSALGDYNASFALMAGTISLQQLEIAMRLGDHGIMSRCRLYAAISFIQQCKFKLAKSIIIQEYHWLQSLPTDLQDIRIANMCLGIWTKLKYERAMHRNKVKQANHGRKSCRVDCDSANRTIPLTSLKEDIGYSSAELIYGTTLRLPGEFLSSTIDPKPCSVQDFTSNLKESMHKLQPQKSSSKTFVSQDLATCTHVFVRVDSVRKPLQPPYKGPFAVIKRTRKTIRINHNGSYVVSIDRVKPAFLLPSSETIY
ncbi:hypothetical protein Pcinc_029802 [Petrolisthes cinctipes]|uniref:Uncharacterized protein n=1 Tax=Petrolisthes cinctipes TaxID=88211 RepID=A0AAE1K5E2_PETCI|nr:hypothetical protein Pcinc_029802 [Petrolisthes cinctipes]